MNKELSSLEQEREQLYKQLQETGDFRRGVSVNPSHLVAPTAAS